MAPQGTGALSQIPVQIDSLIREAPNDFDSVFCRFPSLNQYADYLGLVHNADDRSIYDCGNVGRSSLGPNQPENG